MTTPVLFLRSFAGVDRRVRKGHGGLVVRNPARVGGHLFILTTPYMEEAEETRDRSALSRVVILLVEEKDELHAQGLGSETIDSRLEYR